MITERVEGGHHFKDVYNLIQFLITTCHLKNLRGEKSKDLWQVNFV